MTAPISRRTLNSFDVDPSSRVDWCEIWRCVRLPSMRFHAARRFGLATTPATAAFSCSRALAWFSSYSGR